MVGWTTVLNRVRIILMTDRISITRRVERLENYRQNKFWLNWSCSKLFPFPNAPPKAPATQAKFRISTIRARFRN